MFMARQPGQGTIGAMRTNVITHLDQVTPEWLTAVLTRSGALTHGAVAAFDAESGSGNWSRNARLVVRYTVGAQGDLPRQLFLKMVHTDLGDNEFFGPSEVTYYLQDYIGVEGAPLIRCYDGAYSEALRRYHLLLDDLSATHVTAREKAPTLAYGLALAEGLASLHAHWWGGSRLAQAGMPVHNAAHIRRFVAIAEPGANNLIEQLPAALESDWPAVITDLFARHPQALLARTQDVNGFTLIHGDVNNSNILAPREGDRPIYLIDRQPFDWSLTTWLGAYDLAYALTIDWEIDLRRQMEIPILKHYHATLRQRGVHGYTWEQLFDDYRLSVAMGVYIATEYFRGGVNVKWRDDALEMLRRALTACADLNGTALWS